MARITRSERTEIWQQRFDRFVESSQTVAAFCKTEGISAPSFYQWKRRLAAQQVADDAASESRSNDGQVRSGQSSTTPFTELVVTGQHDTARARLPNGISISLGRDAAIAATIVDRLVGYQPAAKVTKSRPASRR